MLVAGCLKGRLLIYTYIYIYICYTLRSIRSSYSVIVPVRTSVDKICSLLKHLYTKNYCRIANNNFFFLWLSNTNYRVIITLLLHVANSSHASGPNTLLLRKMQYLKEVLCLASFALEMVDPSSLLLKTCLQFVVNPSP